MKTMWIFAVLVCWTSMVWAEEETWKGIPNRNVTLSAYGSAVLGEETAFLTLPVGGELEYMHFVAGGDYAFGGALRYGGASISYTAGYGREYGTGGGLSVRALVNRQKASSSTEARYFFGVAIERAGSAHMRVNTLGVEAGARIVFGVGLSAMLCGLFAFELHQANSDERIYGAPTFGATTALGYSF